MDKSNHKDRKPNRLINEKSPYLLQHAYNPVDWYPWSEEAFEKAKKDDKPIFLSVGYSTCHWCHVMERESFEDQEVADVLNQYFVSIKVDREERPDIDTIYMEVCQATTGHGGWPLTIIMTPEKKPFFSATYLPKNSRQGTVGLLSVLSRINDLWKNNRKMVMNSTESISTFIKTFNENPTSSMISDDIFDILFEQLYLNFDESFGGFGKAPKFPTPHNLYFLMRFYEFRDEIRALEMVEKTLQSMYQGGLYDHIGYGFSRYSTDRYWLVPHFEKMLYDNALLAIAYLEAYQITGKDLYARVAREIFTYIIRDMRSPEGGFYSAEDADSEGIEGKYYVWSKEDIISILGDEEGRYFSQLYNITKGGNFNGRSIPNLINHLIDEEERSKIETIRKKLFEYREGRVQPHKDDKILTSWNGMMIAALAMGARILGDKNYLEIAEKAVSFILEKMRRKDGRLLARYRDKEALYPAYALDYASVIWALIELYQAGFNSLYLEAAVELNHDLIRYFWDEELGGIFLYGHDGEQLLSRPKELYDGAAPSSNSLSIMNFVRLSRLSGDVSLEQKADQAVRLFSGKIKEHPMAYSFFLAAVLNYFNPGKEIVIVGDKKDAEIQKFLDKINSKFMPRTLVLLKEEGSNRFIESISYIQAMKKVNDSPTVYVCDKKTCMPPVNNLEDISQQLM